MTSQIRGATHNFWEFARNNMINYWSPNFHCHLWSSHLGLVYNDPSDFCHFWMHSLKSAGVSMFSTCSILLGYLQWTWNVTLSTRVSFHGTRRNRREPSQVSRQGGDGGHVIFLQEFPHNGRRVCSRVVVVQWPVSVLPRLRPFAPHISTRSSQNLAVKNSHWQSDQVEQTPYAQLLKWRGRGEKRGGKQHWLDVAGCKLGALFSVTERTASSTANTAALFPGYNCTAMIHHQLWPWTWG